jgi:hypothetical protein
LPNIRIIRSYPLTYTSEPSTPRATKWTAGKRQLLDIFCRIASVPNGSGFAAWRDSLRHKMSDLHSGGLIMFKVSRIGSVLMVAALAALVVDLNSAFAQRRRGTSNSGGNSNSNSSGNNQSGNQQNNNNNNDDNKDKNKNKTSSGQSNSTSSNTNQTGQSNSSNSGNSGNSGNNSSNSSSSKSSQSVQQMIQGSNAQNTQSMRGMRMSAGRGQGQGQNQNQSNSMQVQNFQPWQMWQGQNQGQNNRGNAQNQKKSNSNWFVQVGGGPAPFSIGWYEKHPNAWHWKHDNNDGWKVATAAGVIGWLGWGQPYYNTTVVYEPAPVIVFDPDANGPWMPLGVYSLLTGPADTGTRILQLSINPQGYIRGSYYDMITNDTYNVRGRADQSTQYVQWSLDTNQALTFYTPLYQLTQSQGVINVRLPGGTQQWQVVRMESAP